MTLKLQQSVVMNIIDTDETLVFSADTDTKTDTTSFSEAFSVAVQLAAGAPLQQVVLGGVIESNMLFLSADADMVIRMVPPGHVVADVIDYTLKGGKPMMIGLAIRLLYVANPGATPVNLTIACAGKDVAGGAVNLPTPTFQPTGAAGGVLTGTYPNPGLADATVTDAKITAVAFAKITGVPATFAPSGAASGDLTGNYPNPSLAPNGVTPGTYSKVAVDAKGRVTAGSQINTSDLPVMGGSGPSHAIGLVPDPGSSGGTSRYLREDGQWMPSTPGGTAGGDLTGSFPNPTIGIGAITDSKVASVAYSKLTGAPASLPPSGSAGGDLVGSYPNPTMKNTGTAGTYTKVTTDAQGRVTTGTTLVAADLPVFIGSGATHAQGAVPDAGATPGTLKFLREDGGWQVPPGVSEVENAVVAGHTTIAPSGDAVYTAIHAAAQFVAANLFNVNTNSHTVGASERRLFVSFNGAVAITLPVPTILATFEIIDTLGAARETNPITLLQNAAESIGGVPAARKLRTPFGRWTVTTDGSNWWL